MGIRMTKIDKMEAGQELDALVAERVMGWKQDEDWGCLIPPQQRAKPTEMWTPWQRDKNRDVFREPVKGAAVSGIVYSGDFSSIYLPEWSTDIAAAWKVLDKLDKDWRISIHQMWDGKAWQCSLEPAGGLTLDPEVPRGGVFANADTPALAICRAALKATNHGLLTNKLPA